MFNKNNLYMGLVFLISLFVLFTGCDKKEQRDVVQNEEKIVKKDTLNITIGAIITPKGGFVYYRHLLNYLGKKIGKKIKLVDKQSYSETNKMFKNGEADAGFVCSGPYVEGAKEFGLELLVVPQVYGKTTYNSYILVHKNSDINTFEDLRGKTFAFTDPMSNTGQEVPTYMLAKMGETPESFFKKYIYTHGHDKSIWAVVENVVDGVASLVWEYMNIKEPQYTSETKIIVKSEPYSIPPFVVRKGLDKKTKKAIKNVLLSMHKDKKGKKILKQMMIDCFVETHDKNYDSVREMKKIIKNISKK